MSIPPGTDTEKSSMGGGVPLLNGIAQFDISCNRFAAAFVSDILLLPTCISPRLE